MALLISPIPHQVLYGHSPGRLNDGVGLGERERVSGAKSNRDQRLLIGLYRQLSLEIEQGSRLLPGSPNLNGVDVPQWELCEYFNEHGIF